MRFSESTPSVSSGGSSSFKEKTREVHPFPALYDRDSRILILGSFPSVKSRQQNFFYGHPRNRFWLTLAGVLSEPVPGTIEEKTSFLKRNHIALWDVIASCEITGSSDSSIRNVLPNDLSEILMTANIRRIFCNGTASWQYYRRFQEKTTGMEAIRLPSTSPANAACSAKRLLQEWKVICDPLGAASPGMGESLLRWYDYHARILPWRTDPTPYHVWLSEIMLQQTRVETVMGYYERFLERFPTISDLAAADEEDLMKCWEGLGYYRRARHLKLAAGKIEKDYGGEMPSGYENLLKLPGIGQYTAGAISSIAFQKRYPAIDGNVLRVYARILGEDRDIASADVKRTIRREVLRTMPEARPGDFNQALMDLGATVCLPAGRPRCHACPWDTACKAHRLAREEDYPVKKKKIRRKVEVRTVLRIEYKEELVLHKRGKKGLLAGLWELPCLPGKYTMADMEETLAGWGLRDYTLTSLGEGRHIFSHIEWEMTGYRLILHQQPDHLLQEKEWILAGPRELEEKYAIPSAFDHFR